jgi:hypothetical protein
MVVPDFSWKFNRWACIIIYQCWWKTWKFKTIFAAMISLWRYSGYKYSGAHSRFFIFSIIICLTLSIRQFTELIPEKRRMNDVFYQSYCQWNIFILWLLLTINVLPKYNIFDYLWYTIKMCTTVLFSWMLYGLLKTILFSCNVDVVVETWPDCSKMNSLSFLINISLM